MMDQPIANLYESARLLDAGAKLVKLHPYSKRPVGDKWNRPENFVRQIDAGATGYGLPLMTNNLASLDPDHYELAKVGLAGVGFDLDELMDAGVRTSSTRPESGGRSAFIHADEIGWVKFSAEIEKGKNTTVLELRAKSPNLQDCVPGLVYKDDKTGDFCTQDYANGKTYDQAPNLPARFYKWWKRLSNDVEFCREQQDKFFSAIEDHLGHEVRHFKAISASCGAGQALAFKSDLRVLFNRKHKVEEILDEHGYEYHAKRNRWRVSGSQSDPGIRLIPDKDDLWQSDHASDPLSGFFDAWTAYVVLTHKGDVTAAEQAMRGTLLNYANVSDSITIFKPVVDNQTPDSIYLPYPKPVGLLGRISDYMLSIAVHPVATYAHAAAIGFAAGIAGRAFNVSRTGLNQYILVLGGTGTGKEIIDDGPASIRDALQAQNPSIINFDGPGSIASAPALIKYLSAPNQNSILFTDTEFGLELADLSDPKAQDHKKQLLKLITDLWMKSGKNKDVRPRIYADIANNTDIIFAPSLTILGATTIETFFDNFTSAHIASGLVPRFLCMFSDQKRGRLVEPDDIDTTVPDELLADIRLMVTQCITLNQGLGKPDARIAEITPEAKRLSKDNEIKVLDIWNSASTDVMRQNLLNRLDLKARKLAGLASVWNNMNSPNVSGEFMQWGIDMAWTDYKNMLINFDHGQAGLGDSAQHTALRSKIRGLIEGEVVVKERVYKRMLQRNIVPYSLLSQRLLTVAVFKNDKRKGPTLSLKHAIQHLIDTGELVQVDPNNIKNEFGLSGDSYKVVSY